MKDDADYEGWENDFLVIAKALRFYARHDYLTEAQKGQCYYLANQHEIAYFERESK